MSILKSQTVTELCGTVKDTVISTLADTSSQISEYLEKQRDLSVSKRPGQSRMGYSSSCRPGKSHDEWKAEALYRCFQNRQ